MIRPIGRTTLISDPRRNKDIQLAGDKPETIANTPEGYVVSTYRPAPPDELPDSLVEALSRNDLSEAWRQEIAAREVKDRPYEGYGTQTKSRNWNKKTRQHEDLYAYGRYQMTPDALKDAGMMRADGSWTGKYGIASAVAFLTNPKAQEAALKDLTVALDDYVTKEGHRDRIGKTINGVKEKIEITESGLVAAIHRAGIGQVGSYFRWLEENDWNSRDNQQTMTSKFRQVETRLREFQNVPYK
jgi:hypothetical protein